MLRQPLEDLMVTIHPHPTLSEAIMEAAEVAAEVLDDETEGELARQARYSIPFFMHPNPDFLIRTLPTCISEDNPDRYPEPVTANDCASGRRAMAESSAYSSADDALSPSTMP